MSEPRRSRELALRVRRRLARWADPGMARELDEARRRLRVTRRQLRRARAELRDVRGDGSEPLSLPAPVSEMVEAVRAEGLTYLKVRPLRELAAAVVQVERDGLPGVLVEAGTARGGSAIVMASAKSVERPLKVYDVFGLIPPPGDRDGADGHRRYATIASGEARGPGGATYYGYRDDLYTEVVDAFTRHGLPLGDHHVELVRGMFEDTLRLDEPVALAHLDGDWYESTMTCLTRVAPLLTRGGRIVLDDYYMWSGCRRAVDEYFTGREGFRLEHRSRLHVVRV